MVDRREEDNVFSVRLRAGEDQDIIDYVRDSRESNSYVLRFLIRNAFDRSTDFRTYDQLINRIEQLEAQQKNYFEEIMKTIRGNQQLSELDDSSAPQDQNEESGGDSDQPTMAQQNAQFLSDSFDIK